MFKHFSKKRKKKQQFSEDFHEVGVLGLQKYFFLKELISVVICSHNDP